MEADPNSVCTLPQCLGCGRCYRYLTGSECRSCKELNDPQHTPTLPPLPNPPSTFTAPALASMTNNPLTASTPLTASSIPEELFQGGLNQPAFKANFLSNHSRVNLPIGLNPQLQGSIRASQSGRRTVGQPKGKKKKVIEEEIKDESFEIEISMNFLYLSGTGKSNYVRHGLTPRKFKIDFDRPDWFFSLGWDVYAYYLQEAKESAFPSKTQQRSMNKICPLPEDFSSTYCIIAEDGVSVTAESMKSTLISKMKTKKLDKTKFGLIFNMKKYLATISSDTSPKPDQIRKRKKRDERSSNEEPLDRHPELDPAPTYPHTRKRQRLPHSSDDDDDHESDQLDNGSVHIDSGLAQLQPVRLQIPEESVESPKVTMSVTSFGNTHDLARSAKEILPYPPRPIAIWNEGWLLSLITKNKDAVFKPLAISFRVDRESVIGVGRFMQCFKAELLMDNQVHHVVAKQTLGDHCPLGHYQRQAQTYVHVEGIIERFKANVLSNKKFTHLEKDLVKTLRLTRNSLCTPC
ncbi:hypothetical protein DFH28DRAFT_912234 [Melampsora americana]|nr:hypothetical protein DFH28DRAFT_912234 [Melampsora americana]